MRRASLLGSGRKFYLVGFADADGGWDLNDGLAARRAEAVARLLTREGLHCGAREKTLSLSRAGRVHDDDASKAENRRVEVWIEK